MKQQETDAGLLPAGGHCNVAGALPSWGLHLHLPRCQVAGRGGPRQLPQQFSAMGTKMNWQVLFLNSTRADFSLDGWACPEPWAVQVVRSLSGGETAWVHTHPHTYTHIQGYAHITRIPGKPLAQWVKGLREGWVVSGRERTEITQARGVAA